MSETKRIFIAVVGVGGVGKVFLGQLEQLRERLQKQDPPLELRLVLVRRSNKQILQKDWKALDIPSILAQLDSSNEPCPPFEEVLDHLTKAPGKVILVDNTSSEALATTYPSILQKGISIITPNKKAFSSTHDLWTSTFSSAANPTPLPLSSSPKSSQNGYIFHESTVGAGLPVLSTLADLLATGDQVTKIEGVFSGTMSFLFNAFMPSLSPSEGGTFSAEVAKAKSLGYTEPDPRDDLNGLDVARKLTILARLVGLPVSSPTAFPVQSLIPKELESCSSGDEFMQKLPDYDSRMTELKTAAAKEGKLLRFVGSIDVASEKVQVGLEKFEPSHPIAALKGSDNIINFYTKRYGSNPLIVQGAGAGAEVTAMGVTADLLRVIRLLR
ncbi:Homoserine dehydrogenase [Friedmanniomyces endolithicus]|nr:Homoserine dehydrogenase [Friedmanniomyces endolithicus]KAK0779174.1 Homoserine dehydrogenase [Friedmanniomyces endolithicus]KAK0800955.1 Homoserine dehydrogenase [Friedmanniomyces endolithicus]KAK0818798.1 Homoserine dehydrogenase [Friedmanniomyces endolithicus]KAK0835440.1 Homoserine dehydrogenase [Friedmanniomyces endolithicus]